MKKHIHQSNLIENIDDPKSDEQSMVAWEYLKEQTHLTEKDVRKVQKIITLLQPDMQPDWRGYYRKRPVWVGGREGLMAIAIQPSMDKWIDAMNADNRNSKDLHIEFEHIHPFMDGNGRTGRMLMWWHEIQQGREPTLIKFNESQEYYEWF